MACARRVCNQNRRIARTPRTDEHRDVAAGDFPSLGNKLADRPAAAGAEIECLAFRTIEQRADGCDVRVGEIDHMDVIAHAGAVCHRVIVTENRKALAVSRGRLEQQRNGMGFWNVALADLALRIGAGGIEVAQHHE